MADFTNFAASVFSRIRAGEYREVETELLARYEQAKRGADFITLSQTLGLLAKFYSLPFVEDLNKAETYYEEREQFFPGPETLLDFAMFLFYVKRNSSRALAKTQEVLAAAYELGDSSRAYTALSLKGRALLELGRSHEALDVLDELERMVAAKKSFVVGDETSFLECLRERALASNRVSLLASKLAPICRDPAFRERLLVLSNGQGTETGGPR